MAAGPRARLSDLGEDEVADVIIDWQWIFQDRPANAANCTA